jgi:hypothetical protein
MMGILVALTESRQYAHNRPVWTPVEENANIKLLFHFFLERLLAQVNETEKAFGQFWFEHHLKLTQCLQLQHFEHNFCKVLFSFSYNILFWYRLLFFSSPQCFESGISSFPNPALSL